MMLGRLIPLLLPALLVGPAAPERTVSEDRARQAYAALLVQTDPGGVMAASSIRYPAGSARDPVGEEGTAFLLGRALETEARARLGQLGADLEIAVDRDEFLVTLLAPPDRWAEAFRTMDGVLSAAPLSPALVERLREAHRRRLVFEEGAPVREVELERARLLLGGTHPGARLVTGTLASMDRISAEGLLRFRDSHLRRDEAVVAVVGPVDAAEVERTLERSATRVSGTPSFIRPDPPRGGRAEPSGDSVVVDTTQVRPGEPLPPPPRVRLRQAPMEPLVVPAAGTAGSAWSSGDRTVVDRELTSAWMVMAWPFSTGTPTVLLEFLAQAIEEAVVPSPPGPGHYSSSTRIDRVEGHPVLLFLATVDPRIANTWERRIVEGMSDIAAAPPTGSFFELGRRRYRTRHLLEVASPDTRSRWLVRRVAEEGEVPDVHSHIWRLTEEGLAGAAASAGPPRILIVGPSEMMQSSR